MALSHNDIKKLARLSRLSLNEAQQASALQSLNEVLTLIDQLQSADVKNIDPMAYVHLHTAGDGAGGDGAGDDGNDVNNNNAAGAALPLRPPEAQAAYDNEALMQNAPESRDNYFLVPKVIE